MAASIHDLIFNTQNVSTLLCDVLLAALYQTSTFSLTQPPTDRGAGIYCLYYCGETHPLYNGLSKDIPIYIGKALHAEKSLSTRLREHARSIDAAQDLNVSEFEYRVLQINPTWIAGCEVTLINYFSPLWNTVVRGFGCHAPGKGRQQQEMSPWDMLHMGRTWAYALPITIPITCIIEQVQAWCEKRGFPARNRARLLDSRQILDDHF